MICPCQTVATSRSLGHGSVSGNKAIVPATVAFDANPPVQHFRATVVKENGGWLVDDVACRDGSGSAYQGARIC